jgi:hypothetical protein
METGIALQFQVLNIAFQIYEILEIGPLLVPFSK